jgi:hypothetical protein
MEQKMHKQILNKKVFNKSSGFNTVSLGNHILLLRMAQCGVPENASLQQYGCASLKRM